MKLMLIAGFGFRASANIHSLANAFEKTATGGLVDGFSAPADKIDHPALTALARRYELPVYAVETETIKTMDTLTQSATVRKWRQIGSVAEAAALAPFTSPAFCQPFQVHMTLAPLHKNIVLSSPFAAVFSACNADASSPV